MAVGLGGRRGDAAALSQKIWSRYLPLEGADQHIIEQFLLHLRLGKLLGALLSPGFLLLLRIGQRSNIHR